MGGESRFVLDAVDAKVNIQSNPAKSNKDEKNTFVQSEGMAWDSTERVLYKLPFDGKQLPIFLDALLPRVCDCNLVTHTGFMFKQLILRFATWQSTALIEKPK